MAPIRIAFIGLSANRCWGTTAHLPYLRETSKYQITGICNSSQETSQAAIKAYDLPASTKAYGSLEELANDTEAFDLAVCSVRVDRHYDAIKAIAAKGKQCYVEWPLGKNLQEAQELFEIVKKSGNARTVVGLQARRSPVVNTVKKLIADRAIGRVLSSSVLSSAGNLGQVDNERMGRLFNDSAIGANMITIHFGHMIDYILYALDDEIKDLSAVFSTQRKKAQIKHDDGHLTDMARDTPDQIMLQGYLKGGAVLSVHQRGGSPFKGEPGLRWRIYGESGEIEVTSGGSFLQVGYPDMTIKLHDHKTDEIQTVDWATNDEWDQLPLPAKNIARLYEAFAEGDQTNYADWEQAVGRHKLLEKMEESSKTGRIVSMEI